MTSSSEPLRSDTLSLSDELSRSADTIKWSRGPEMRNLGEMFEIATVADYYCLEDPTGTSASERAQLYKVLPECAIRKILDSRAPPMAPPIEKQTSLKEVDAYTAVTANEAIRGIGEVLRPRQDAAAQFSESLRGGRTAPPPCKDFGSFALLLSLRSFAPLLHLQSFRKLRGRPEIPSTNARQRPRETVDEETR